MISRNVYDGPANDAVLDLLVDSDRKVLDLGCGAGSNARKLHERGVAVDGVTWAEDEASAALPYCRRVLIGDLEAGLPKQVSRDYDVVLAAHVIEHLREPTPMLQGVRQLLESSRGRLIVAIPNLLYYKNRLTILRGRFEYENAGLMDSTHYRWYTYDSCERLLRANGFRVTQRFGDGGGPLGPLRKILPRRVIEAIDRAFATLLPGLFGYQLIYVAVVNGHE